MEHEGQPTMLLTSASVKGGASGAPVLSAASGQLLGMVTSNTRHALGKTYPKLNFVLPGAIIAEVAGAVAGPGTRAALEALGAASPDRSRLWNLGREEPGRGSAPPVPQKLQDLLRDQQVRPKL